MSILKRWPKLTRRQLIKTMAGGGLASALGLGVYSRWIEPHWLEIVTRDLPIAGLPLDLAGKRLIQISDIHVGPVVDDQYIIRAFKIVTCGEFDLHDGPRLYINRGLGYLRRVRCNVRPEITVFQLRRQATGNS